MAATVTPPTVGIEGARVGRRSRPVVWWAAAGTGFVLLQLYIYGAWILSGPERISAGPDPVPGWMKAVGYTWQVVGWFVLAAVVYRLLIRPLVRERRLTTDGMLVIGFMSIFWQDPLVNYIRANVTFNAMFPNWGSWGHQVPGWISPTGHQYAEPLLWVGPAYVYATFFGVACCTVMMNRARRRWPEIGNAGLIGVCLISIVTFDLLMEIGFVRLGIYSYPGAIRSLTLFAGHYYQFPVYGAVLFGSTWAAYACLRYFKNERGETYAERGASELSGSARRQGLVRCLAIVGALNVTFLCFNVAWQVFALHGDPWPQDTIDRSYLVDKMCGEGTGYACSGPDVPIPTRQSVHVGPTGGLRAP